MKRKLRAQKERGIFTGYKVPRELVEQILMKLPCRSLVRFESVCKSWKSLITSRSFLDQRRRENTHRSVNDTAQGPNNYLGFRLKESEKIVLDAMMTEREARKYGEQNFYAAGRKWPNMLYYKCKNMKCTAKKRVILLNDGKARLALINLHCR